MKTILSFIICLGLFFTVQAQSRKPTKRNPPPKPAAPAQLLLRCDDVGMSHAVNMATKQLIESNIPLSASVMFACPWYLEAVEILKAHPQIAVGIHLTLGSEWKNYKWGPISGKDQVPSLVDSLGYFHATPAIHLAHNPNVQEVEQEFRAQIERALASGLRIDYVDNHMGAGLYTPEQRQVLEKLAKEYTLSISGYLNETFMKGTATYPYEEQADSLAATVSRLKPDKPNVLVMHLGLHPSEMDAMEDLNAAGTRQMSRQRQTELNTLLSPQFRDAVQQSRVKLITYRELIDQSKSGSKE